VDALVLGDGGDDLPAQPLDGRHLSRHGHQADVIELQRHIGMLRQTARGRETECEVNQKAVAVKTVSRAEQAVVSFRPAP
jgi:hypothetical protein